MSRESIQAKIQTIVGKAARETGVEDGIDKYLDLALEQLNIYQPRLTKTTITGDGSNEYPLPAPWEDRFSVVNRVLYYSGRDYTAAPLVLLEQEFDADESDANGNPQIRVFAVTPSAADDLVVEHTARHDFDTVNAHQELALAHEGAAGVFLAAAGGTTGVVPQGADTDFVGFTGTQGDAYRRLAQDQSQKFDQLLGIDRATANERKPAQTIVVTQPARPNARNRRYMTHPGRDARYHW